MSTQDETRPRPWLPRPLEWLYIALGLALVYRYFWLMDDAFVYFRYIDNWLFLDVGLVFNRGEFVEGYTSSLWLLILSAFRALGLDYLLIVKLLAGATFVGCALCLVRLNRALAPAQAPVVNLPLAFLAFNYGVSCYFSSGLEMPLVQWAGVLFAFYLVRPGAPALDLALALTPLLRHELALPLLLLMLWSWWSKKRFPWRLVVATGVFGFSWLAFRIWYYADLFPNTFYLKDITWYAQGLRFVHNTLGPYHLYVLLPIGGAAAFVLRRRGALSHGRERLLMIAFALPIVWYVVRVGGDARHYRYLAFPFCLIACVFGGVGEGMLAEWTAASGRLRRGVAWALGVGIAAVSFAGYPPQLSSHPIRGPESWLGNVHGISDAGQHRRWAPVTSFWKWHKAATPERGRSMAEGFEYTAFNPVGPCANFYLRIDTYAVQPLGLTQPFVARTQGEFVRPAHRAMQVDMWEDLLAIYQGAPRVGRGMFREALDAGRAPEWVARNIDVIEVVERKVFNTHDLGENVGLAFTFPGKIAP